LKTKIAAIFDLLRCGNDRIKALQLVPLVKFNFPGSLVTLPQAEALLVAYDLQHVGSLDECDFQAIFLNGNLACDQDALLANLERLLAFVNIELEASENEAQ